MRSLLVLVSISIGAVLLATTVIIGLARHENHIALERAYAMMRDADHLKVNEATLEDVLLFVKKYQGEERSSKPTGSCQRSDCMAETNVSPSFYAKHTALIPVVKRIGVHVFELNVTLWVEDGRLTALEEIFFVPRAVGADMYVTTMISNPGERNCRNISYQLHPGFITSYRERYGAPEFTYWSNARNPQDPLSMRGMDLDCVTTISGCRSVSQVLPYAWARHVADQPKIEVLQKTTPSANAHETSCK
jgi:hypothetical protein